MGNLAPGRYWLIAQAAEESDSKNAKSIKADNKLRATIMHEAETSKREIEFKPCERKIDYDLPYNPMKQ